MSSLTLIRHLCVEGANAISSPITYGFPAMTQVLGFVHRVQRLVRQSEDDDDDDEHAFTITGFGVVCHRVDVLATYVDGHRGGRKSRFNLTGNPLERTGKRPSFIEEGKCHLDVSVVLESNHTLDNETLSRVPDIIFAKTRFAAGTIVSPPRMYPINDDRRSLGKLMPGWGLIERRDLMRESMAGGRDALEAMHDRLAVRYQSPSDDDAGDDASGNAGGEKVAWPPGHRMQPGNIVPVAVGYQALSPVTPSRNARDRDTPHRFAESVLTLGEFVLPMRLRTPADLLWRPVHEGDLYVCRGAELPRNQPSSFPNPNDSE